MCGFHDETGAAGKDEAIKAVHNDLTWRHLNVRAPRLVNNNDDGAEICTVLLVTARGCWSTNQLPVYSYTLKAAEVNVNIKIQLQYRTFRCFENT